MYKRNFNLVASCVEKFLKHGKWSDDYNAGDSEFKFACDSFWDAWWNQITQTSNEDFIKLLTITVNYSDLIE